MDFTPFCMIVVPQFTRVKQKEKIAAEPHCYCSAPLIWGYLNTQLFDEPRKIRLRTTQKVPTVMAESATLNAGQWYCPR